MNKNGQRDDDEEGMANVVAVLCDAATQDVVGQTVTNNVGEYIFENVTPGEYYVRFEYDSSKYTVSDYKKQGVNSDRNSDAIVSNYKAVTDKIKVTDTSISDIDIGLVRAGIFDLSLDANLNKVTVQNDEGANTYEMENPKLAKIDINPKYVNSSKIFAEYTISVTNRGEISGYAKSIVDYLPEGLELDTSMNNGWYVGSDGNAYTNQLEDILIQPGETKEIKLILTKQMTENGNGIINNCTIKKVIKGSDLMVNDEIKIYDLISIWKVFGTYYLGGSTPLKIGNEYIVFLKKTINASVSNTYVFASVKYGHLLTSIENKILENYEQNSLTIDEISNYNFVFSKDSNKTEIEIYKNISKQIIEMIY